MRISEALTSSKEAFGKAGIEEAAIDARVLLCAATGMSAAEIIADPDRELSDGEQRLYRDFVLRRANREPTAYITGCREFMGLDFLVGEGVLVPRPDTETLVEEAMLHLHDGMRFMDLCTGTGCVALSLLNYSNGTEAVATDISETALAYALKNAENLGLADRIELKATDLFPSDSTDKFDIIVSNPPYIPTGDIRTLMPEVREHEPWEALDGGTDGMFFYNRIIPLATEKLYSGGWLLVEAGFGESSLIEDAFRLAGFKDVSAVRDLGGVERVVKGCLY